MKQLIITIYILTTINIPASAHNNLTNQKNAIDSSRNDSLQKIYFRSITRIEIAKPLLSALQQLDDF